MTLTKKEVEILKILVEKELENLQQDSKNLLISNSPFFGKVALDDDDLKFIKDEKKYEEFLNKLAKNMKNL